VATVPGIVAVSIVIVTQGGLESALWLLGFLLFLALVARLGILLSRRRQAVPTEHEAVLGSDLSTALRRVPAWDLLTGLLLVIGSQVLWFVGPGATVLALTLMWVLSIAIMFMGIILLVHGLSRVLKTRKVSLAKAPAVTERWDVYVSLGIAVALCAMILLSSVGIAPGFYLSSPGSSQAWVVGCQEPAGSGVISVPQGFPPESHVHVVWATQNRTVVQFYASENKINSGLTVWEYSSTAASGAANLIGTGGTFGFRAESLENCTTREEVDVSWTYEVFP